MLCVLKIVNNILNAPFKLHVPIQCSTGDCILAVLFAGAAGGIRQVYQRDRPHQQTRGSRS